MSAATFPDSPLGKFLEKEAAELGLDDVSTAKHTPLVADNERVRLQDGTLIATVWEVYPSKDRLPGESWLAMMGRTEPARQASKQEARNRARLIAAAPDLLEAATSARAMFFAIASLPDEVGFDTSVFMATLTQIESAIARATGEAT